MHIFKREIGAAALLLLACDDTAAGAGTSSSGAASGMGGGQGAAAASLDAGPLPSGGGSTNGASTVDGGAASGGRTPTDGSTPTPSSGSMTDSALATGPRPDAAQQPGAGQPTAPSATMCSGKPLPPRALGKAPPFAVGPESAGLTPYWPTSGWRKEDPEKLGFDSAALAKAIAFSTPQAGTLAVFVVRHGYVAAEMYARGSSATTQHESYSMAKSFTSGLIGIAIAEGKIASTEERICSAYPAQWDCAASADPRSRITIDHAMNLTTGLQWSEDWRSSATGWNDALSLTMLDDTLAKPAIAEPGGGKRYSTGDPALLSGVLEKATGMTPFQYAKQKLFDVIGIPGVRWNTELTGRPATYAYLQATAAEYAKYGYLYLQRGSWDGKQVIPADWVDRTTRVRNPCEDWNQYLWHVNLPIRLGQQDPACASLYCPPIGFADLPTDGFFAEGLLGQFIFIVPSADLVVVRLAEDSGGLEVWEEQGRGLLEGVIGAIR